jgi:hypothetical protein
MKRSPLTSIPLINFEALRLSLSFCLRLTESDRDDSVDRLSLLSE